MKTIIVPKITASEEHAHRKKEYPHGHRLGNKAEKENFGKKQFNWLNRQVQKLPKGHFAATHTTRSIHISQEFLDIIPKPLQSKVKRQLKIHEVAEHKSLALFLALLLSSFLFIGTASEQASSGVNT